MARSRVPPNSLKKIMAQFDLQRKQWGWVVLFASSVTLVCCALPILLVSVGLGALSAALFANLPFLTFFAQYKSWLFILSASLIGAAAWVLYRPDRACPSDLELARQCAVADRWNKRLLWGATGCWVIGFTGAYLSVPLLVLLEN